MTDINESAIDVTGLSAEYRERLATIHIDKSDADDVLFTVQLLESELRDDLFFDDLPVDRLVQFSDILSDRIEALQDYAKGLGCHFPDDARRDQVYAWANAGNTDVVFANAEGVIEMDITDAQFRHNVDVWFQWVAYSEIDDFDALPPTYGPQAE